MAEILRSREEDQVIQDLMKEVCNPENPMMFFPVRHHSPACSYHLQKILESYAPDCILIEGPENANELIPVITDEETKAPFAIYYFYRDKKGYVNEEKGDYKCYYPFLDYSPELVGMRYGKQHQVDTAFIDLPYSEILIASEQGSRLLKQDEKNNYNDDYLLSGNAYIENLCDRAGVRNFDEFWEKYFEINGVYQTTENFIKQMLTYCYLSRSHTKKEDLEREGCLSREAYMAEHILEKRKTYQKIMVITGGFHTFGLWKLLKEDKKQRRYKTHKMDDSMQGAYLMAYSMEAADALNGYASGMPYPGFYQKTWTSLIDEIERPYEETVLSMIIAAGKAVRKKEGGISAFDEICAYEMAQGLAALRNKKEAGAFDLYDSILSSFIKGEVCISTETPLILLREIMTGKEIGALSHLADLPPIIKDFQKLCAEFKLKIASTVEQETVLQLFSSDRHKKLSEFFHQTAFLHTDFARKIKGPNLKRKKDKNLIRETWKYKWSTGIFASLTDVSVYGGTIREACQNLVSEKMKKLTNSEEAAMLFAEAFEMNLSEQRQGLAEQTMQILMGDSDFFSLAGALSYFTMLSELSELYHVDLNMEQMITMNIRKLFVLIPSMGNVKDEDSDRCMDALKNIYKIMQEKQYAEDKELYFDSLKSLLSKGDGNPCILGCVMGLLYGGGQLLETVVEQTGKGFLNGTKSMEGAKFFRGLFSSARDIIFGGNALISIIDSMIRHAEDEKFMQLLPDLRLAFAYFTPTEIDKIAAKAAALYGKTKKELMDLKEVLPADYSYGKQLDAFAQRQMGMETLIEKGETEQSGTEYNRT